MGRFCKCIYIAKQDSVFSFLKKKKYEEFFFEGAPPFPCIARVSIVNHLFLFDKFDLAQEWLLGWWNIKACNSIHWRTGARRGVFECNCGPIVRAIDYLPPNQQVVPTPAPSRLLFLDITLHCNSPNMWQLYTGSPKKFILCIPVKIICYWVYLVSKSFHLKFIDLKMIWEKTRRGRPRW